MFYMGLCWCPCVIVKQRSGRTSRNISFKAKKESSILHAERQSGANESQQECNAVWLILGSLSAWFYWEKWDDDRWISALTAGVEGRVIVAERWRVFSVLAEANQSGLLSERCRPTAACVWHKAARCKRASHGVTPVSVLLRCWGCHGWCRGGWRWREGLSSPDWMWADGTCSGSVSVSEVQGTQTALTPSDTATPQTTARLLSTERRKGHFILNFSQSKRQNRSGSLTSASVCSTSLSICYFLSCCVNDMIQFSSCCLCSLFSLQVFVI